MHLPMLAIYFKNSNQEDKNPNHGILETGYSPPTGRAFACRAGKKVDRKLLRADVRRHSCILIKNPLEHTFVDVVLRCIKIRFKACQTPFGRTCHPRRSEWRAVRFSKIAVVAGELPAGTQEGQRRTHTWPCQSCIDLKKTA